VLHLQPGVHLDKEELVLVDYELDGPRPLVAYGAHEVRGGGEEAFPDPLREVGRGRLLDELLVAALDGAVPLGEGHRRARGVREHLHLDVPQALQEALRVDGPVAEAGPRLPARREKGVVYRVLALDDAHPLAPAPGARLDDQRVADLGADPLHLSGAPAEAVGARRDRDARPLRRLPGRGLVPHHRDYPGGGADELQAHALQDLGEARVLGEKPVAGVDGLGTRQLGGGDDGGHVQVALGGGRGSYADRFVGELVVQGVPVGGGVDRHAPYAELAAGPDYPERDLPPVGDEDLADHLRPVVQR
jgi:hypothetical protein